MTKIAPTDVRRGRDSRRRFVCLVLLLAAGLLHAPAASLAQPAPPAAGPDLLATGTASSTFDSVWVVRVAPQLAPPKPGSTPGLESRVFLRRPNEPFTQFGPAVSGRAVAIAPRGLQLAMLFDDGEWVLQSATGATVMPALPLKGARLITLGGDGQSLLAVARVPGGSGTLTPAPPETRPAAATQPSPEHATAPSATQPATKPATQPSTAPAAGGASLSAPPPESLVLLAYNAGSWVQVADVPSDVARPIDPISLTIVDGTPFLLVRESTDAIRLWRVDGQTWTAIGEAPVPTTARKATLIPGGPRPTVLLHPGSPVDADRVLAFDASRTAPATTLPTQPATRAAATGPATQAASTTQPAAGSIGGRSPVQDVKLDATVGVAPEGRAGAFLHFGPFRSITLAGDTLTERPYDRGTFAPLGSAPAESTVGRPGVPWFDFVQYGLISAAMLYAIVASVRRRDRLRTLELDPAKIPLAPLGARLLAGLIDAVPFVAALVYAAVRFGESIESPVMLEQAFLIKFIGAVVYVVVVTLAEVLLGRSFGKIACGLRVVSIDGSTPTKLQLLERNLLRIIDVFLQFIPLLLIPLSPLRQRAGDAAAGTLVITSVTKEEAREQVEEE